jgi:hypothetical protein
MPEKKKVETQDREQVKAISEAPKYPQPRPFNIDKCFTYHPPTDKQKLAYDDLALSYRALADLVKDTGKAIRGPGYGDREAQEVHDEINETCKEYVQTILENCPNSADKSAAIRCVRLIRNGLNDAVVAFRKEDHDLAQEAMAFARFNLLGARYQANASVALDGEF